MSKPNSLLRISRHALKFSNGSPRTAASAVTAITSTRCLATVQTGTRHRTGVSFTGSMPHRRPANLAGGHKAPDERTLKLGKTLRILQARLPTLLQSPLPKSILSPQIHLHLFPSTHPHLPTVSGRVAYIAALWTSPIAWGRVPIVGNVRLEILSERMINKSSSDSPLHYSSGDGGYRSEQLVVRWRTIGKPKGTETFSAVLDSTKDHDEDKEFTGLFMFEFDDQGRIVSHTIEHVQEGGSSEKGVGTVVKLTDWLLGGLKNKGEVGGDSTPCPAYIDVDDGQKFR